MAAVTDFHKLLPYGNAHLLRYSSGGHKSKMGFTGSKSRCWWVCVPSGGSREALPFQAPRTHLHSLSKVSSPVSSDFSDFDVLPFIHLQRLHGPHLDILGNSHVKILNLIRSAVPFLPCRAIHRFQGLGCGHLGGTIILPTNGVNKMWERTYRQLSILNINQYFKKFGL